jgi:rsbT co-antagonist protein RsbR
MQQEINVGGISIAFDLQTGVQRFGGLPVVTFWIDSSMAGLIAGLHRMVGTERFNLAMQSGGRESVEGDWAVIAGHPTFEEGFKALAVCAAAAGWGNWQLLSIDRKKQELRVRITSSWESSTQRTLGVCWGSSYVAGKLAGYATRFFETNCWAEQTVFASHDNDGEEFIIRPSGATVEAELANLLRADKATQADLAVAMEQLRHEVVERQQTEQHLREKLALIEQQERDIRAMSTPILEVGAGIVALPVIGNLDGRRAATIMDELLAMIAQTQSQYAILDLTGVEVVDTQTADHLLKIVRSVNLLGARSVVTGIRPAVAQAMTALGFDLSGIVTRSNLREGLELCMRERAAQSRS